MTTKQELVDALTEEWIRILPELDYEIQSGTPGTEISEDEEPIWAWKVHPWKRLLGWSDDECLKVIQEAG